MKRYTLPRTTKATKRSITFLWNIYGEIMIRIEYNNWNVPDMVMVTVDDYCLAMYKDRLKNIWKRYPEFEKGLYNEFCNSDGECWNMLNASYLLE